MPFRVRRGTPFGLKMPASWRNGVSGIRPTDFFIFGGHIFRHLKSRPMPPEFPGCVDLAGVYTWLLTPARWPFWCFLGCFVAKNPSTPTQEVL
jgi:hypothetical protein